MYDWTGEKKTSVKIFKETSMFRVDEFSKIEETDFSNNQHNNKNAGLNILKNSIIKKEEKEEKEKEIEDESDEQRSRTEESDENEKKINQLF